MLATRPTFFLKLAGKATTTCEEMLWFLVSIHPYHFVAPNWLTQSVLLRVLEYYEGILILTTNRMRSLDIAVQSRIRKFIIVLVHYLFDWVLMRKRLGYQIRRSSTSTEGVDLRVILRTIGGQEPG